MASQLALKPRTTLRLHTLPSVKVQATCPEPWIKETLGFILPAHAVAGPPLLPQGLPPYQGHATPRPRAGAQMQSFILHKAHNSPQERLLPVHTFHTLASMRWSSGSLTRALRMWGLVRLGCSMTPAPMRHSPSCLQRGTKEGQWKSTYEFQLSGISVGISVGISCLEQPELGP